MYRRLPRAERASLAEQFGLRSVEQVRRDVGVVLANLGGGPDRRFPFGPSTLGFARPDLALPAYAGLLPKDGVSPIYHFFDRTGGGRDFRYAITRDRARDYRGGRLTYDEHDGTDFVCPPGTPLPVAAPGVLVAARDTFLRGGLTACVDHGHGVVTQYTHLTRLVAQIGQPLRRGDIVGLSGTAGLDMLSGFPWVPPHVHFMVWVRGRPVDPYRAPGEGPRPGTWRDGNVPRPSGPLDDDPAPPALADLAIDIRALEQIAAQCRSPRIAEEIDRAPDDAARAAILEDSLHHDRDAWPAGLDPASIRRPVDASAVRLTLPLPASDYVGARASDAPWTRPATRPAPHRD